MTTTAVAMGSEASRPPDMASCPQDIQYCGFDISALPEELFMQVLMFVPATDVVRRCSLVCKLWLRVARDQSLWRRKCEMEDKYVASLMGPPPENFMVYYFKNPYCRNLLKNTHAESRAHWKIPRGMSLEVETSPAGADPIADHVPAEEIWGGKVNNWVTSYRFAHMSQLVDLLEEGCSELVLDEWKLPIQVSAWCTARWDCGARFHLGVKLLDKDKKELDSFEKEMLLVDGDLRKIWHKVEHVFRGYKSGVRMVEFRMGGIDTQFWAGNYGSKFTLPCVRFLLKEN